MSGNAHPSTARRAVAWSALALLAVGVAAALRTYALGSQVVIDDEWHALHKVMRSNLIGILTHLDYADFSIPVALYYRALQETIGITEWSMRAPMVVAGIALVALAPWLARAWTTRAAGVAWSVLLAISPMLVYLSRTARPYAITALTSTVAIVAFERWWRGDEPGRTRWAIAYVVATVLGGWLHMLSLAFTLVPFLYFGARAMRDRAAFARLFPLGLVTASLLAVVLLPPLVNDWSMFAAKAGQDAVGLDTLERSLLMIAGTGHASVGIAFAASRPAGMASLVDTRPRARALCVVHRSGRVRSDRRRAPELGPVRARVRPLPDPRRPAAPVAGGGRFGEAVAAAQQRARGLHRRRRLPSRSWRAGRCHRSGTHPTSSRATSASSSTTTTRTIRT